MAQATRFYKVTKGFNAEVIVAKNVAYTDDLTYENFVANAVDGEIGVFNERTHQTFTTSPSLAITAGMKYFIAQKRDGGILKFTKSIAATDEVQKTSYTAPVKQVTTVTFAGTIGAANEFQVDDLISVKVIETTPGAEPFPTITYDYMVVAGDTTTSIATALKNQINSTTDPRNIDGQGFIVATSAAGVLTLTAKYFQSSFRVAIPGDGYTIGTVAYTTPFKNGSGYYEHVRDLEVEGQIYDGVTTQYPMDGSAPTEWGTPTKYASESLVYDIYNFKIVRDEKSPTPVNKHHHYWNAILCIPTVGGPSTAITTILGFLEESD